MNEEDKDKEEYKTNDPVRIQEANINTPQMINTSSVNTF